MNNVYSMRNFLETEQAGRNSAIQEQQQNRALRQQNALDQMDPMNLDPNQLWQAGQHEQAIKLVQDKINKSTENLDKIAAIMRDNVTDQDSYEKALTFIGQAFPESAKILERVPKQYDPYQVGMFITASSKAVATKPELKVINGKVVDISRMVGQVVGEDPTSSMKEYNLAVSQGYRGTFDQWNKETKRAGASNIDVSANANTMPLGKPAMNKVEESLLDQGSRRMRLNAIQQGFKPEYMTYAGQARPAISNIKEKLGGTLSPQEQAGMREFTDFKIGTLQNLNAYIKEITGAALSESEAKRIIASMPNMEMGPTQFKSALDKTIRDLNLAEARLVHIKNKGLRVQDPSSIGLESIPLLMKQRAGELIKAYQAKGMSEAQIKRQVRNDLAGEFGLIGE